LNTRVGNRSKRTQLFHFRNTRQSAGCRVSPVAASGGAAGRAAVWQRGDGYRPDIPPRPFHIPLIPDRAPKGRRQIDERLVGVPGLRESLFSVVTAGARIAEAYDHALASQDLTLAQYQILEVLSRNGSAMDSERFLAHLRRLCVDQGCARHVEREGWLERDHDAVRRLTGPGRALLARVAPILEELEDELTSALGGDEIDALRRSVSKVPAAISMAGSTTQEGGGTAG